MVAAPPSGISGAIRIKMASSLNELALLRAENAKLKALLTEHGIPWQPESCPKTIPIQELTGEPALLSPEEKIQLFRRLFRGRDDVYPVRWENQSGKAGYSPVCANEWRRGYCQKPRIKCADCSHAVYVPPSEFTINQHLRGKITAGIYPLLKNDHCYFLAIDFDDADWREDAKSVMQTALEIQLPAALEISRSGEGAHLWVFFSNAVPAREARRLGAALISATCARTRQLKLESYDRVFPNQDTLPKGGFGNLIALPLQKQPRELGRSVFVDANLQPYADQWGYMPLAVSQFST